MPDSRVVCCTQYLQLLAHHQLGTHPVKRAQIACATMSCFAAHSGPFYQKSPILSVFYKTELLDSISFEQFLFQREQNFFYYKFIRSCYFFWIFHIKSSLCDQSVSKCIQFFSVKVLVRSPWSDKSLEIFIPFDIHGLKGGRRLSLLWWGGIKNPPEGALLGANSLISFFCQQKVTTN